MVLRVHQAAMDVIGVSSFPWSCLPPPHHPPSSLYIPLLFPTCPFDQEKPLDLSMKPWNKSEMPAVTPTASPQDQIPPPLQTISSSASLLPYFPFGLDQNMACPFCRKDFRFEKNLLRHMQKAHATGNGESVLKCKLCPYTTRHYSNMYVHIRTHTGDKPYSCAGCGASFTQGSSLKLHIKSRHGDNMELFSLFRKPGKNNLTKLWTRVLKHQHQFNFDPLATPPQNILPSPLLQSPPTTQIPSLNLPVVHHYQSPSDSSTASGYSTQNETTPVHVLSSLPRSSFSVDSLTSSTTGIACSTTMIKTDDAVTTINLDI